jgi:hypothetical protein
MMKLNVTSISVDNSPAMNEMEFCIYFIIVQNIGENKS